MKRVLLVLSFLIAAISCGNAQLSPVERALQSVVHMTGTVPARNVTQMNRGDASTQIWLKQAGDVTKYGCSAWAIDVRKFVTAAHCIGDDMKLDGHPAFVIAQDNVLDLAVIVSDYVKPGLTIRQAPLTRDESTIGLGYGFSWLFPTITHHKVMILSYTPSPEDIPTAGVWYYGPFIGGQSGGAVIDEDGLVVGVIQRGSDVVGYGIDSATLLMFLASVNAN